MSETVITVQGRFSAYYPPERATLFLGVHLEGSNRDGVFSATNESADLVRGRITGAHDRSSGPITWFSSDNVQIWTEKPWNANGLQLDPVFHAQIGFTVKFSDFVHLARFVEDVVPVPGVTVDHIEWTLTDTSRLGALAEVRSRAVKDSVAKATVYAQSIGLGTVRAIALADEGMLSDLSPRAGQGPSATSLRLGVAPGSAGPELSLKPEDIEVAAVIDARFLAT